MVKNDKWIKKMAMEYKMIEPFESCQIKDGKISYGTSSYGYDIRLSNEFKRGVFTKSQSSSTSLPSSSDNRSSQVFEEWPDQKEEENRK
jgi:dCTP deaminase